MQVILTSDFPSNPPVEVIERIRAVARQPRVAWVAPASTLRRLRFLLARRSFRAIGVPAVTCVDLFPSLSNPTDLTSAFDVVYLSGGPPIEFRANLQESGLVMRLARFARAGGLVVGASGGAVQLTPNLSVYRLLENDLASVLARRSAHEGLALVTFEFLPHLNRHNATFLERVRQYSEAVPHDIIGLEDGGAVLTRRDGDLSVVGRAVRFSRGAVGRIETTA